MSKVLPGDWYRSRHFSHEKSRGRYIVRISKEFLNAIGKIESMQRIAVMGEYLGPKWGKALSSCPKHRVLSIPLEKDDRLQYSYYIPSLIRGLERDLACANLIVSGAAGDQTLIGTEESRVKNKSNFASTLIK
jgi:hypothetical protein